MSANGQDEVFGDSVKDRPATKLSPEMSFEAVAKGLGNEAATVTTIEDIKPTVEKLLDTDGPALLELIVSRKPTHPGTVAMVGQTKDKNVVVISYYDNVPRPQYHH